MNIEDYYLDLKKISKLENEDERKVIHDYYRDMLSYNGEKGREDMAKSIMNTLVNGGYLLSNREEKIEKVLS
jgi:hypothetical protein